ncbi:uncharacterized protein [Engystomops pustulosus]|uniref:uncharacterized protein n=1 Tax=Engystomops pustulosus TaxID=76066 RepID=UPI003AFAE789
MGHIISSGSGFQWPLRQTRKVAVPPELSSLSRLFIISDNGLQMDLAKLSAVLQWPHPVGLRAIQRFLDFANYYRQFIPHVSSLVSPIVALTKKNANPRLWPSAAEETFSRLKSVFALATVLTWPDTEKTFQLEVDASSVGAGAVLTQKGSNGRTLT